MWVGRLFYLRQPAPRFMNWILEGNIEKEELKMGTNVQADSLSADCTKTMNGALMLIESLKKENVEMIFGYPGEPSFRFTINCINQGWFTSCPATSKARFMRLKGMRESPESRGL